MTGTMLRAAAGVAFVSVCMFAAHAEPPKLPLPVVDQSAVAQRGYFYVGGKYTGEPGKEIMQGQTMWRCWRRRTCASPTHWC
jgi:hypothetical protein